jgi:hypothetical protein
VNNNAKMQEAEGEFDQKCSKEKPTQSYQNSSLKTRPLSLLHWFRPRAAQLVDSASFGERESPGRSDAKNQRARARLHTRSAPLKKPVENEHISGDLAKTSHLCGQKTILARLPLDCNGHWPMSLGSTEHVVTVTYTTWVLKENLSLQY